MRFFYPSIVPENSGTIEILGQSEWNVWELRKQLGYVNSEIDFHFSHGRSGRLTGFEAVLTGFSSTELEVEPEHLSDAMREAARGALRRRDAGHLSNRIMSHLSTGERRRVLLARALVHEPKAVILDEPTTGLDIASRQQLLQQMQTIAEEGTTLVLVTHHVEEIVPAIQHVVLLQAGRSVFQGDRANGLSEKRLSELFRVPICIENDLNGMLRARVAS
jgi:iron complex transport system ATP-binding protein